MSIVNKVKDVLWLHILFKLYRRSYCCLVGLNIFFDINDINDIYIYIYIYIYTIYTWLTILSCYGATPLALGLIGMDGGLSTLGHSCWFACQQRVLKTFPGPGYLRSEDGVV